MRYLNEGARRLPRAAPGGPSPHETRPGRRHSPVRALPPALAPALAAALAAAGCGTGGAGGPLAGLTGSQVSARALADLKAAPSLHVAGTVSTSGQAVTLDLSLSQAGGCSGSIAMSGSAAPFTGSVQVTVTGKTVYILPDQRFWDSTVGSGGGPLAGKWIRLAPGDQNASSFTQFCTAADLAGALAPTPGSLSRSAGPPVSGTPSLDVSDGQGGHLYVSDSASPEVLRISGAESGTAASLNFSAYGAPVRAAAPPAASTVDASKAGL
jgi:hypothetical protein